MSKKNEHWVDLRCQYCGKPTEAKINTLYELVQSTTIRGTCLECQGVEPTPTRTEVSRDWVESWVKASWKGESTIRGNIYAILRELGVGEKP